MARQKNQLSVLPRLFTPRKTFNALDWLARLVTHIPGRYEQTVRYYAYYSNNNFRLSGFTGIKYDRKPLSLVSESVKMTW